MTAYDPHDYDRPEAVIGRRLADRSGLDYDRAAFDSGHGLLMALRAAGWDIVRHSDVDTQLDDDPDSPTYGQIVTVWTIADEWTP